MITQVQIGQRLAGAVKGLRIDSKESFFSLFDQLRMQRLVLGCEEATHRNISDGTQSLGLGRCGHAAKGCASGFAESRATVGQHQTRCQVGMANGRHQGDEATVAIAQQDRLFCEVKRSECQRDVISNRFERTAYKIRAGKAGQAQGQHLMGLGQGGQDQVEAALVSQQGMKQHDGTACA